MNEHQYNEFLRLHNEDTQIQMILHPAPNNNILVPDKQYKQTAVLERNRMTFVVELEDIITKETVAAKIWRPDDNGYRHQTTRKERCIVQKECSKRTRQFALDGLCIGLRPILPSPSTICYFGPVVQPGESLNTDFEYVWFMHKKSQTEALDKKLLRNYSILANLPEAVIDVHRKSDTISLDEAWKFANPQLLQRKFLNEIDLFFHAVKIIHEETLIGNYVRDYEDRYRQKIITLGNIFSNNAFIANLLEERVAKGNIKRGHGDLLTVNFWYSDEHRDKPILKAKDCFIPFDAIDFNSTFNTIDTLSEFAMLATDLLARIDTSYSYYYDTFLYSYLTKQEGGWNTSIEFLFTLYAIQKSMARTIVHMFDEKNIFMAQRFMKNAFLYIEEAERLYESLPYTTPQFYT